MEKFLNYSPAMLKTFEQCEKKFEYKYIKGINLPVNTEKMQQGKNIHAMANYFLNNFDISKLEKVLTESEKKLWDTLKNNKYFKYEILHSEYSVTAKYSGNWINGRFDALVKNNNSYYILDYKTGSIPKNPEMDYQTLIYLLIADKLIKNYDKLAFVYIDLKNNHNTEIEFTEELKKKYITKSDKIIEEIKRSIGLSVFRTVNTECHCEYAKICKTSC